MTNTHYEENITANYTKSKLEHMSSQRVISNVAETDKHVQVSMLKDRTDQELTGTDDKANRHLFAQTTTQPHRNRVGLDSKV